MEIKDAAARQRQLRGWYWAKQGGLLVTVLAAAAGHYVASRRKRKQAGA